MTRSKKVPKLAPAEMEIVAASEAGSLLDFLYERSLNHSEDGYSDFCTLLTQFHNSKKVDLLEAFSNLKNDRQHGRDFWILQDLFVTIAPQLDVHTDTLMKVVDQLVGEGGEDLASNRPNSAFRDWLKIRPDETDRLLQRAQQSAETKFSLLTFVFEAGATFNFKKYKDAAIEFLKNESERNRISAATALGRIDASHNDQDQAECIDALCQFAETAESDHELTTAIGAMLAAYARAPEIGAEKVLKVIQAVSKHGYPNLHYVMADSLGHNHRNYSGELQTEIITALGNTDPSMKGVVDQIDFSFAQCLSSSNRAVIADCIQKLCEHTTTPLELEKLDSFTHALTAQNRSELSWFVIHWLRFGSHTMRLQIPAIFHRHLNDDAQFLFSLNEFDFTDEELLFICKKAIGYFLINISVVVSILTMCLEACKNEKIAEQISEFLFDPLMLNFSGQARQAVEQEASKKSPQQYLLIRALEAHDKYIEGLRSVGSIKEMHPSPSERQSQAERQRQEFARSHKEAEKQSVFLNFVTRQTLLSGRGSVHYLKSPDGTLHRCTSLLSSHGTSIEFPRLEAIDPVYFQHMILKFRQTQLQS